MNSKQLELPEGHFCYWCGKEMERHYDYSERSEWYTCNCTKALKYDQLVEKLNDIKREIKDMKQEPEAIERFYSWQIDKLKRNMEIAKGEL